MIISTWTKKGKKPKVVLEAKLVVLWTQTRICVGKKSHLGGKWSEILDLLQLCWKRNHCLIQVCRNLSSEKVSSRMLFLSTCNSSVWCNFLWNHYRYLVFHFNFLKFFRRENVWGVFQWILLTWLWRCDNRWFDNTIQVSQCPCE